MSFAPYLVPTLILFIAFVDDMKSQKVHNYLLLTLIPFAIVHNYYFLQWNGVTSGIIASLVTLLFLIPLFAAKIIGGGDVKLMFVFGLATHWKIVISVIIFSLIWGAVFGLIQSVLKGQIKQILLNITKIVTRSSKDKSLELHKIPFTVAFLLGWFTYLQLNGGFKL